MNLQTPPFERRLPLEGAFNVRDLGGYPAMDGRMTQPGRVFRADGLHKLTAADQQYLLEQGIGKIVDLRHEHELLKLRNVFADSSRLTYHNVSLVNPATATGPDIHSLGEMYIDMLDHAQAPLLQVFELLAERMEEKVLFHCAAGKDRTGVTAALLLDLAGVPHEYIIADYALTAECIAPILPELLKDKPEAVPYEAYVKFMGSDPLNMEMMLEHLDKLYGGAEKYLSLIGLSGEQIAALKGKLLN